MNRYVNFQKSMRVSLSGSERWLARVDATRARRQELVQRDVFLFQETAAWQLAIADHFDDGYH